MKYKYGDVGVDNQFISYLRNQGIRSSKKPKGAMAIRLTKVDENGSSDELYEGGLGGFKLAFRKNYIKGIDNYFTKQVLKYENVAVNQRTIFQARKKEFLFKNELHQALNDFKTERDDLAMKKSANSNKSSDFYRKLIR